MSVCLSARASVKPTQPLSEWPRDRQQRSPPLLSGTRELSANVNFGCCNRGAQADAADVCSSSSSNFSVFSSSLCTSSHLLSFSASLHPVLLCWRWWLLEFSSIRSNYLASFYTPRSNDSFKISLVLCSVAAILSWAKNQRCGVGDSTVGHEIAEFL